VTASAVARSALFLAGVFALVLVVGFDLEHCVLVTAGTGVVLLLRRLPGTAGDEWPERQQNLSDSGVRREVARLSWGLHGHEGRVDRRSALRLRSLASRRLERVGIDLDDPGDAEGARRLLGDQAYATLTAESAHPPRYDHFARAVVAVQQLSERNSR